MRIMNPEGKRYRCIVSETFDLNQISINCRNNLSIVINKNKELVYTISHITNKYDNIIDPSVITRNIDLLDEIISRISGYNIYHTYYINISSRIKSKLFKNEQDMIDKYNEYHNNLQTQYNHLYTYINDMIFDIMKMNSIINIDIVEINIAVNIAKYQHIMNGYHNIDLNEPQYQELLTKINNIESDIH